LDDLGWIPAIRFLAEGRIETRQFCPSTSRWRLPGGFPATTEIALYRVVQEALTNAHETCQGQQYLGSRVAR